MTDFKYVDDNKTLWEHYTPTIVLTVDVRNGVLYHADIAITKPCSRRPGSSRASCRLGSIPTLSDGT